MLQKHKRIVVITSNALRHKFFANTLANNFEVCGIFSETKSFNPALESDSAIAKRHFAERDQCEIKYFGSHQHFILKKLTVYIKPNHINDASVISRIKDLNSDIIAVFGSSLLGAMFFEEFDGKMINMHLGLSPYYRGSGTNFWPLVNNEPEFVGATIHLLSQKIDGGDIVRHARPDIDLNDTAHDLGNKAIISGTQKWIEAVQNYIPGISKGTPQWRVPKAKLCRRRDLTEEAIKRMYKNFSRGMIKDYLEHKAERDKALRLIDGLT
jgi:methionyl-tRNA formyltransferase